MFSVQGKVAVVTGGTSGIGLATARRLAAAGAQVVVAARHAAAPAESASPIASLRVDVTDDRSVQELAQCIRERYGRVDVLVASAGGIEPQLFEHDDVERYRRHFDVNCLGVARAVHALLPLIEDGASLIFIGSLAGLVGFPAYGAYAASKAALIALTRTLAVELAPRGVRVNCICPGTVATAMAAAPGAEAELAFVRTAACLGRLAAPGEIAALAHFLAADDCRYITGQALVADGGIANLYGLPLLAAAGAAPE